MPLTNNRPTPNLQAPTLSIEDLGKVNAFYAPLPPAHSIQALNDAMVKSTMLQLAHPPPKTSLTPIQTNVKGQEISIELPLSPIGSTSSDYEQEASVLYLTVEDAWDEESGQVMHQLVEIPM